MDFWIHGLNPNPVTVSRARVFKLKSHPKLSMGWMLKQDEVKPKVLLKSPIDPALIALQHTCIPNIFWGPIIYLTLFVLFIATSSVLQMCWLHPCKAPWTCFGDPSDPSSSIQHYNGAIQVPSATVALIRERWGDFVNNNSGDNTLCTGILLYCYYTSYILQHPDTL